MDALDPKPVRLSELVSALSYALDLVEGQPAGHAVRTCLIGMRIAETLGLNAAVKRDLYYALLLKDAGCSSNATRMCQIVAGDEIAAKAAVKTTDWTKKGWENIKYAWTHIAPGAPLLAKLKKIAETAIHQRPQTKELVQIRCDRGASIALEMGFSEATADAIRSLDEHWNGGGYPDGLVGEEIPLLARILNLSQTLEVYWREREAGAAVRVALERSKRWFDPKLAKMAARLGKEGKLFHGLAEESRLRPTLEEFEPTEDLRPLTDERIDSICAAFASVVDAKSPYTFRHSLGVTSAAMAIAQRLELPAATQTMVRRAALLHDAGKLSVPNSILEKPGKLDAAEWLVIKRHPYYTHEILNRIPGFEELAEVAASHHEKLDGTGYWRGLMAQQMPLPSRLLAVADIYDALAAKRPYRDALPPDTVFGILGKDVPHALDATCVGALKESVYGGELEMIENLRNLHAVIQKEQYGAACDVPQQVA
jgi:putative nucleotidyltransferase with HDIG domain